MRKATPLILVAVCMFALIERSTAYPCVEEVTIANPTAGAKVTPPFTANGTYSPDPPNGKIMVLVYDACGKEAYYKEATIKDGKWSCATFGPLGNVKMVVKMGVDKNTFVASADREFQFVAP